MTWGRVFAVLGVLVLLGAGVAIALIVTRGDDDDEPNIALERAADVADLRSDVGEAAVRLVPTSDDAEPLAADAPSDEGERARIKSQLEDLQSDASSLATEISNDLEPSSTRADLADSASCLEEVARDLEEVARDPSTMEAVESAERARDQFDGCSAKLRSALEAIAEEDPEEAEEILAEANQGTSRYREAFDGVVTSTRNAHSNVIAQQQAKRAARAEARRQAQLERQARPGPGGGEISDLPMCAVAPPPCLAGGQVVEP